MLISGCSHAVIRCSPTCRREEVPLPCRTPQSLCMQETAEQGTGTEGGQVQARGWGAHQAGAPFAKPGCQNEPVTTAKGVWSLPATAVCASTCSSTHGSHGTCLQALQLLLVCRQQTWSLLACPAAAVHRNSADVAHPCIRTTEGALLGASMQQSSRLVPLQLC